MPCQESSDVEEFIHTHTFFFFLCMLRATCYVLHDTMRSRTLDNIPSNCPG